MPKTQSWEERRQAKREADRKAREAKRLKEAAAKQALLEPARIERRERIQQKIRRVINEYTQMARDFEQTNGPQPAA